MIRAAKPDDAESVVAIYNQAIIARFQTAFMQPFNTEEGSEWFHKQLSKEYPMFVYTEDDRVVGWCRIAPYRSGRAALKHTVEISYFVHNAHIGKGIGTKLINYGIEACRQLNYRTMLAIILDKNMASIKLMKKLNFEQWAYLPDVADFDGVICGHVYYGLRLNVPS